MAVALGPWAGAAASAAPVAPSSQPTETSVAVVATPAPGSVTASPATGVSFRAEEPIRGGDLDTEIVVTGSESGPLAGAVELHRDGRGLTFTPEHWFAAGETVTVEVPFTVHRAEGDQDRYTFAVGTPPPASGVNGEAGGGEAVPGGAEADAAPPPMVAGSRTRPDLRPPAVVVNPATTGDTSAGLLFATPRASALTDAGVLIYDDDGEIVYFRPSTDPGVTVGDASVTELDGEPVLHWFEGVAPFGPGNYRGEYVFVDTSYREVARIDMVNGYRADIHDVHVTANGTAIMIAYNAVVCDQAVLTGCTPGGVVLDGVVQEIDIATGAVLFEWHGLDHLSMADSYANPESEPFDYLHLNSVDVDDDGDILLSARHTSALYKIDRTTGEVIFIFGGRSNEFSYVDEGSTAAPGPDYPHDFRPRGDGVYSYFDNGVRRHSESRGAIVELDSTTMTATYLETITHEPPLLGPTQGRMQVLPNGNALITWGGLGVVTEYAPDGDVAFEASLGVGTYRQVRHDWVGAPTERPVATLIEGASGAATLAVSWNGDTRTESWQLLAGSRPDAMTPIDTVARTGFETEIVATDAAYLAVRALDSGGQPIRGGRTETLQAANRA